MSVFAFTGLSKAMETALLQAPAVADVVMRGRYRALAQAESTGVVIRWDRSTADQPLMAQAPMSWATQMALDLYVRADASQAPEDALEPLLQAVWNRLQVLDLSSLAVTNLNASSELAMALVDHDPNLACVTLFLTVEHDTQATTLNVRS